MILNELSVLASAPKLPGSGRNGRSGVCKVLMLTVVFLAAEVVLARDVARHIPVPLKPDDVIATGNEWIALPAIRAADGALTSFNVLSMRDRGLLEVTGDSGTPCPRTLLHGEWKTSAFRKPGLGVDRVLGASGPPHCGRRGVNTHVLRSTPFPRGTPVLEPYIKVDGHPLPLRNLSWELIEYWIPAAHLTSEDVEVSLTYCAPPGSRAAFIHMTLTNRRASPVPAVLGMTASWGALHRVTYTPVELRGDRTAAIAAWMNSGEVFSYATSDTQFAWSIVHPGAAGQIMSPPEVFAPVVNAQKEVTVAPGETVATDFIIAAGLEEFSAPHNAKALREEIDRHGADKIIADAAAWCHARAHTTGQPDLDLLMNRNFLFTTLYAWGKTIDTEQFVGVTSRSPRYYVSAAYWDRDAMLWSFPGVLDIDPAWAREALEYALTTQLRNTGVHSRFIDGVVLEDGFELDEGVAPIVALAAYVRRTGDDKFLLSHRDAVLALRDLLLSRFDPETGLYTSLQDSQDEYQKLPFLIYDNVLSWRAVLDLAALFERMNDQASAQAMTRRAAALHSAIMKYGVSDKAPGAGGPIFASATDGKEVLFTDIPPGSLLRLPALGFVPEDDPVFVRTYEWLHSANYKYSYSDLPYGLPGSYRLPFTTSWSVADHLLLSRGKEKALKILRESKWDAGIVSEGLDPSTAAVKSGGAFATAAGYVAHAICERFCEHSEEKAAQ